MSSSISRSACLAVLVLFAGCEDEYSITLDLSRANTDVSLSVGVCDTVDTCTAPLASGLTPVFANGSGSLTTQVAINVDKKKFMDGTLRLQFQHGGTIAHCDQVDVGIETVPIELKATVKSDGSFVELDCGESTTCTTPITCPPNQ